MQADILIKNVQVASMDPSVRAPYGTMSQQPVAIRSGKLLLPDPAQTCEADLVIDGQGGWLTPGLVDCHTHLVYGGNRAQEWESRLRGVRYEEIARAGGGIVSTVKHTRSASSDELFDLASVRLQRLLSEGVTTVEIKSGYGLETATEVRMLEVATRLGKHFPVSIQRTFLGAHALPPEFADRADAYIDLVVNEMLPAVAAANLADAVDVFCENIGFSRAQCERVFDKATQLGLPVKGHVEQLSDQGGASLVAAYNGLSVDHVEFLPDSGVAILKQHEVVPVLLPGAFYFLNETKKPPIAAFREAGLPMAIGSDLNPGSSPIGSMLTTMNLACVLFGLTPEEALAGATRNGAAALGLQEHKGMIKSGMDADLVLWPIDHPSELSYGMNLVSPSNVWVGGVHV